jgi:hypothetical protein
VRCSPSFAQRHYIKPSAFLKSTGALFLVLFQQRYNIAFRIKPTFYKKIQNESAPERVRLIISFCQAAFVRKAVTFYPLR